MRRLEHKLGKKEEKMKRISFLTVLLTIPLFLFTTVATTFAQENGNNLEDTLKKLSQDAAKKYVSPIVTAFGSDMNGGWFHRAPQAKMFSLNLEAGLVGMGTFFPEEEQYKHFSSSGSFRFDSEQARKLVVDSSLGLPIQLEDALVQKITNMDFTVGISGATIIGRSDDYITINFSGEDVTFQDPITGTPRTVTISPNVITLQGIGGLGDFLADISFLPFMAPQASIGTILGTQAVFRYFPEISLPVTDITQDIGKFKWFGWGIQHNPGVFFPTPLPLDISFGFFKQSLKINPAEQTAGTVTPIFEANTTAYGVTISKRLGVGVLNVTPYAGYLRESSKITFAYDFTIDPGLPSEQKIPINFYLEGENKSRINFGLSVRLLLININADYNILGKYKSITVGVMFAL
jgi:hypothetical protein